MTKIYYEPESKKTSEENISTALFAIANELHEINAFVALLSYGSKVLPDGTSYERGAIENLAFEVKQGFENLGSHLIDR